MWTVWVLIVANFRERHGSSLFPCGGVSPISRWERTYCLACDMQLNSLMLDALPSITTCDAGSALPQVDKSSGPSTDFLVGKEVRTFGTAATRLLRVISFRCRPLSVLSASSSRPYFRKNWPKLPGQRHLCQSLFSHRARIRDLRHLRTE